MATDRYEFKTFHDKRTKCSAVLVGLLSLCLYALHTTVLHQLACSRTLGPPRPRMVTKFACAACRKKEGLAGRFQHSSLGSHSGLPTLSYCMKARTLINTLTDHYGYGTNCRTSTSGVCEHYVIPSSCTWCESDHH